MEHPVSAFGAVKSFLFASFATTIREAIISCGEIISWLAWETNSRVFKLDQGTTFHEANGNGGRSDLELQGNCKKFASLRKTIQPGRGGMRVWTRGIAKPE